MKTQTLIRIKIYFDLCNKLFGNTWSKDKKRQKKRKERRKGRTERYFKVKINDKFDKYHLMCFEVIY